MIILAFVGQFPRVNANAGTNTWTTNVPEGPAIVALAIDPGNPATIYAGSGNGVFKSVDFGRTWSASNNGLTMRDIRALVIDPLAPAILYAGTSGGVFKSTDAGASWVNKSAGMTNRNISVLAIDPINPDFIYAGTNSGLFKSTDGGESWSPINKGLPPGATHIWALAIDPVNPTTLYAGTVVGIMKSTDGGANWIPTVFDSLVGELAIHPGEPSRIYAATLTSIYKSANGGQTWVTVPFRVHAGVVNTLVIDPTAPDTIYVGATLGVFKTTNAGGNWTEKNVGIGTNTVQSIAIDPLQPTNVYAGTRGIVLSVDAGETWATPDETHPFVSALKIEPGMPQAIYAGTAAGVFKSTDANASWVLASTGLTNTDIRALAIDPNASPAIIYAGTVGGGVFKSTDGGANWNPANNGLTNTDVRAIAIDSSVSPAVTYAGTSGGGLFKSADGGANWNPANNGLTNGDVRAIAIDPTASPAIIYAGTFGAGVFKSSDGGLSWSAMSSGLTATNVQALAFAPTMLTTLYAGTVGGGVFRSINGENSWIPWKNGLTSTDVRALEVDPSAPKLIYAATFGGGVFDYFVEGADLALTSTESSDPATVGKTLTYSATVSNLGPDDATGVVLTDTLPEGVELSSITASQGSCILTDVLTCNLGNLSKGLHIPVTIAVTPKTTGLKTNSAIVTGGGADPNPANNSSIQATTVPVHDLAITRITAPARITLRNGSAHSYLVAVEIQNRSPHTEMIQDMTMLTHLINLEVESRGACPSPLPLLHVGRPQKALPYKLNPKKTLPVYFSVTIDCANDAVLSTKRNPGHEDYSYTASIDHAALDGELDTHTVDDMCPRSVTPPFETDPNPDGTISDKGCGAKKPNKTFGGAVLTDVVVK
ncbi:MAG: DUF11 domain-containing protein [Deltaproteobacteria bacterium]|nr:DUF11 domain-containing protein [Deltaproteobacteria bacterium]